MNLLFSKDFKKLDAELKLEFIFVVYLVAEVYLITCYKKELLENEELAFCLPQLHLFSWYLLKAKSLKSSNSDEYENLKRSSQKLIEFTQMIESFADLLNRESMSSVFISLLDETGYKEYLATTDKDKFEDRLQNLDELNSNLIRFKEENPEGELLCIDCWN